MSTSYYWKHEVITGASLSGTSGTAARTYGLAYSNAQVAGMQVNVEGSVLLQGTGYTLASNIITFTNPIWDAMNIIIDYQVAVTDAVPAQDEYCSTLQVVRLTGLGVEVFDEVVGTGTGTANNFDLDNGNVIASSYTLSYAASGSNSLTPLTETTHYIMNKDEGRIVLTIAGLALLSTNILYASYTYSPKMSDTVISTYLSPASIEVDKKTGSYWGTEKLSSDYFDGRSSFTYPTTDQPYAPDWDEPDYVVLNNRGVNSISGVYFLASGVGVAEAYVYDSAGDSYSDVTSEMNSSGGTSFQPFASTTASGDYLYVGAAYMFSKFNIILNVVGVTSGTNTLEYYNGSSWVEISVTESTTGVLDFEASGSVSWSVLSGWTKTTVNSGNSLYYIRFKANSTYSTEATIEAAYISQDDVISERVALYNLRFEPWGKVSFLNNRLPNGNKNIRIDYRHGYSTPPEEIAELTAMFAGLRCYANITGGSYDDATSFTMGRQTISIGEVYVNVREVVNQFRDRIKDILNDVGEKMDVV